LLPVLLTLGLSPEVRLSVAFASFSESFFNGFGGGFATIAFVANGFDGDFP